MKISPPYKAWSGQNLQGATLIKTHTQITERKHGNGVKATPSIYINPNQVGVSEALIRGGGQMALFSKALQRVRDNNLPPSTQWTNNTIFLHTIWTNFKEANTYWNHMNNALVSPNCSNCGNQPERTKHLFYDSALATNMWMAIISDFNEQITEYDPTSQTIQLSMDMILFN